MRKAIFHSTDSAQEILDALHIQHRLKKRQETIRGVRRIFSSLSSPFQFLVLQSPHIKEHYNPCTYQGVYNRFMFYDREEPLQANLQWLKGHLRLKGLLFKFFVIHY